MCRLGKWTTQEGMNSVTARIAVKTHPNKQATINAITMYTNPILSNKSNPSRNITLNYKEVNITPAGRARETEVLFIMNRESKKKLSETWRNLCLFCNWIKKRREPRANNVTLNYEEWERSCKQQFICSRIKERRKPRVKIVTLKLCWVWKSR
jgi:hypothetical protein